MRENIVPTKQEWGMKKRTIRKYEGLLKINNFTYKIAVQFKCKQSRKLLKK